MGKCLFMRKGETHSAPKVGIELSTIAEGSIVKINENGTPVEFYVAKHDYEPTLNGEGRTLLTRKEFYDQRQWHSSNNNAYASSSIDSWLNGDYKQLLDSTIKDAISMTQFYCTVGYGDKTVTTLSRSVFLLSVNELGMMSGTDGYCSTEGSTLPIASTLVGTVGAQWTRSARTSGGKQVFYVYSPGCVDYSGVIASGNSSRPCFTLPSNALFDETTLLFKGVA